MPSTTQAVLGFNFSHSLCLLQLELPNYAMTIRFPELGYSTTTDQLSTASAKSSCRPQGVLLASI